VEHRNKFVVNGLFREILESQRKDNTPLLHLIHSDDLKHIRFLVMFSIFSFKDLLFEFLSLTVKVSLIEWYLMLQSRKLTDDSTSKCSWIQGTS
jgi:hypothetical protein